LRNSSINRHNQTPFLVQTLGKNKKANLKVLLCIDYKLSANRLKI